MEPFHGVTNIPYDATFIEIAYLTNTICVSKYLELIAIH